MLRPEVVQQLQSPSMGLATSWAISRHSVPCKNLETIRDGFKRECWPWAKGKVAKSNPKAIRLREEGNAAYKKSPTDPDRALELYNQSICTAEEGSEELGIGYANRSAVYFNRKMYRECLHNIRFAKENHYPDRLMGKLVEREERCLKLAGNSSEPSREDKKIGNHCSITSCLEMNDGCKGVRTTRNLNVGERVLLEKRFLFVLEPEFAYKRCDYCGQSNGLNLRPCKTCTSVMYCSEECQEQAMQRYHQFECEVIDDLHILFRGPKAMRLLYMSLRLFWHGVLAYLANPEHFSELCKNSTHLAEYRNLLTLEPSDYFLHMLLQGLENVDRVERSTDEKDLTGRCVLQFMSVLIYVVAVEENTSLAPHLDRKSANETLRKILFTMLYLSPMLGDHHMAEVTSFSPFSRLMQHSCAPNAERLMHNFESIIVMKRPVSKGQQITIAYGNYSFDHMDKEKRQKELKSIRPTAECNCEGCTADYPTLDKIEKDETLSMELQAIRAEANEATQRNKLIDFLQRYNHLYPKRELAEAWNTYKGFVLKEM